MFISFSARLWDRVEAMKRICIANVCLVIAFSGASVFAIPTSVSGDPFTLVATGPGTSQLFGLTSDSAGRVYVGNNSNNTTGISVQRFDPSLFSGSAISLQNFGPAVGDADGIAQANGLIFVPDQNEGLRQILVADQSSSVLVAGASINPTGSPIVVRPSDGTLFIGFGATVPGAPGQNRIDAYTSAGTFLQTYTTVGETETMAYNPINGLIYYADFDNEIRSYNIMTHVDAHVGNSSGTIDGALTFDTISGKIFVGTANGVNSGRVETIDPVTGATELFATGFNGSLGILREPVSGDLYFLEDNSLYRIESAKVPEPRAIAVFGFAILSSAIRRTSRRTTLV